MITNQDLIRIQFHGSYLDEVSTISGSVRMKIVNLTINDIDYFKCIVILFHVDAITRDDKPVQQIEREGEGASVIAFILNPTSANLILDWNFEDKPYETRAYTFQFERFEMKAEPAPPP